MDYNKYGNVTKTKLLLLKYGVKFEPINIFNKLKDISTYKTKLLKTKIVEKDNKVFNCEVDTTIIPSEILISKGNNISIAKLRYNENSPIVLKLINENIILEHENRKLDVHVEMVKKNLILEKKLPEKILNNGSKIDDYIQLIGIDRIGILFFEGCYNWMVGKPCKFCNLPHSDEYHKYIPNLNNLQKEEFNITQWWNKYKKDYLIGLRYSLQEFIRNNNLKHYHIAFMSGNLMSNKSMWNIAEEVIEYLGKEIEFKRYDCYLNITPHDHIDRLKKIKELGIKQVQYNLEVVNEKTFNDACPNKINFYQYIHKLKEAVTILGRGNVRSNFVFGLNTLDETIEFAKNIAAEGIVCDYTVFQPKKGTLYSNKKPPNFNDVIEFSEKLSEIYKQHEFKPIFCELSSRSCIINEIYKEQR